MKFDVMVKIEGIEAETPDAAKNKVAGTLMVAGMTVQWVACRAGLGPKGASSPEEALKELLEALQSNGTEVLRATAIGVQGKDGIAAHVITEDGPQLCNDPACQYCHGQRN